MTEVKTKRHDIIKVFGLWNLHNIGNFGTRKNYNAESMRNIETTRVNRKRATSEKHEDLGNSRYWILRAIERIMMP